MFISVLRRQTAITDRTQWDQRLKRALPRLQAVMQRAPGFLGVEYLWATSNDGAMAEITRWSSRGDFKSYLKSGAAATAATFLDGALPTAAYPNGNWLRQDFEPA